MKDKQFPVEPLMLSASDAARALSMSRSFFYTQLASGTIGPTGFRFGSKLLFPVQELKSWIAGGCLPRRLYMARQIEQDAQRKKVGT